MFSVVIPLYNKECFIGGTLESVLWQTFQDYEVVIVDDGSVDGSAELAEKCLSNTSNWKIIRQANAGVSAARNRGIASSNGTWIAFLDADDIWHPTYLSTMAGLIHAHPALDMVASNLCSRPERREHQEVHWPALDRHAYVEQIDDLPRRWFKGLPFITSCVAVRTATLQNMQPCFYLGESNGEDIEMWFRLSAVTTIARTSLVLVAYTEVPAGGLSSRITRHKEAPYLNRLLERVKVENLPRKKRAGLVYFVAQQRVSIARRLLERGERLEALRILAKAWPVAFSRRWLTTLIMATTFPRALVQQWDKWRYLKKAVRG